MDLFPSFAQGHDPLDRVEKAARFLVESTQLGQSHRALKPPVCSMKLLLAFREVQNLIHVADERPKFRIIPISTG
jgi:hypothetical protein